MKRFKEYLKAKKEELPILNTVFGTHSHQIKNEKDIPILNTIFGKHSKKDLKEEIVHPDIIAAAKKAHETHGGPSSEYQKLHDHLTAHYKNFDDEDKKHIKRYTENSISVNNYLHKKHSGMELNPKSTKNAQDEDHANHMTKALHKHTTPEDMHVYSGIQHSPEHVLAAHGDKHGVKVRTTNFTSTSISKHAAQLFAEDDPKSKYNKEHQEKYNMNPNHMLRIHVPKGTHGAYVDSHSVHRGEREFILPHGTHMHIHPEPTYNEKSSTYIWHAHVIPHEEK